MSFKQAFFSFIRALPVSILAGIFTSTSLPAVADDSLQSARQRGTLIAGVSYVVPPYVAGARFRTPESIETALVEDIAARLRMPSTTVQADRSNRAKLLKSGEADILLLSARNVGATADALRRTAVVVPTAYSAAPMAIMRTDTDIKSWKQLRGRLVCLSEGGAYVGAIAAKYGAIEKVYKAPADSLLALRIGDCDAAVHDDTMLLELLTLPEWKKFSAKLTPIVSRTSLLLGAPVRDAQTAILLKQIAREWETGGFVREKMKNMARNIAFEVYLSQDVPDCH